MAHSTSEQRARYPLAAYNFRVSVDGVDMAFSEVSGLQREHQLVTYRHGLSFREGEAVVKYRLDKYVSLTFKRGTVLGSGAFYEWVDGQGPCSMAIRLCDAQGVPVIEWQVAKALPIKLDAPTLSAKDDEVSIESLEVKAAGISVKELV